MHERFPLCLRLKSIYDNVAGNNHHAGAGRDRGYPVRLPVPKPVRHTAVLNSQRRDPDGLGQCWNELCVAHYRFRRAVELYAPHPCRRQRSHPTMWATSTNPAGGQVSDHGLRHVRLDPVVYQRAEAALHVQRRLSVSRQWPARARRRRAPMSGATNATISPRSSAIPRSGSPPADASSTARPIPSTAPTGGPATSRPRRRTFNGNATDYTYDARAWRRPDRDRPVAPTRQNGLPVRPQTRHKYAQRTAWISNGGGGYVQAATPIWVLHARRSCRTSAATGNPARPATTAGDEVLTEYDYGPNSGPNTLLLRGQTVTATRRWRQHDAAHLLRLRRERQPDQRDPAQRQPGELPVTRRAPARRGGLSRWPRRRRRAAPRPGRFALYQRHALRRGRAGDRHDLGRSRRRRQRQSVSRGAQQL